MTPDQAIELLIDLVDENRKLKAFVANLAVPQRVIIGATGPKPATGPERPNRRKLTEFDVKDIRRAYQGGMKPSELARTYGVHRTTISRAVRYISH